MKVLKILVNDRNEVVGTARVDAAATGDAPPAQATMVARKGQRVIEVTVDDETDQLDAARLHAYLKANHVR